MIRDYSEMRGIVNIIVTPQAVDNQQTANKLQNVHVITAKATSAHNTVNQPNCGMKGPGLLYYLWLFY